jgi:hypothetical protein
MAESAPKKKNAVPTVGVVFILVAFVGVPLWFYIHDEMSSVNKDPNGGVVSAIVKRHCDAQAAGSSSSIKWQRITTLSSLGDAAVANAVYDVNGAHHNICVPFRTVSNVWSANLGTIVENCQTGQPGLVKGLLDGAAALPAPGSTK